MDGFRTIKKSLLILRKRKRCSHLRDKRDRRLDRASKMQPKEE